MTDAMLASPARSAAYRDLALLIDGAWLPGDGRAALPVETPATGETLGALPMATPADVERAIAAAGRAFPHWRATPPRRRAAVLHRAAALIRERSDDLSRLMALELGKPVKDGPAEVGRAAELCEWHAEQIIRTTGDVIPGDGAVLATARRTPIGPVAAFTPWNGPGASPARKISAAIATGCSIVIKPAEETPATALALAECFQQAGLPDGVLNMVFGDPQRISETLIASPVMRMVTFTGSVPVGRSLAVAAGRHLKPCILELGGHAPVIVCADADPEDAARQSVVSKFRNTGQICISPTRFFVHEDIAERFTAAFVEATAALIVGDPLSPDTQMGPLVHRRRLDAVDALIKQAVEAGATLRAGGHPLQGPGHFYAPTILSDVPDSARILTEEPFGPVAIIQRFSDLEDACARANATDFGLAAYAFTGDSAAAAMIADRVESGVLSINHFGGASPEIPFGGVKDSGYGREGGAQCFDGYLTTKAISHRTTLP